MQIKMYPNGQDFDQTGGGNAGIYHIRYQPILNGRKAARDCESGFVSLAIALTQFGRRSSPNKWSNIISNSTAEFSMQI
jgi:hypothetical protein